MIPRNSPKEKAKIRLIQRNLKREKPDHDDPNARKGCLGKKTYASKTIAREAAKRLQKQFGTPYKAYHCRFFSGHYHLTTQVPEQKAPPEPEIAHPGAPEPLAQSLVGARVKTMVKRVEA